MKHLLTIVLFFCIPCSALAQDGDSLCVNVKGFVDTYHAVRSEQPNDWMSSRTRVRGEVTIEKGNTGAYVSANLIHNAILKDRSGFQLREAYAYYSDDHWDVRAGRQIITWGVADALRLTDIISPMDYTEFLAQDYDDIRIPVGALRLRYSREKWCFEAVAIPVSSFFELPTDDKNPWSVGPLPIGDEPNRRLSNMEYGGRLSFFLSGIDFSFSALGEVAEYLDEAQTFGRAASTNALFGIDWYAGNDWSISAQYSHKYIACGDNRNSGLATLRISKELLHNTLALQSFAYVDVTNGGVYNRLSADYAINDQLHATIGYDYFHADRGMFTIYKKNSELFFKLKYSF